MGLTVSNHSTFTEQTSIILRLFFMDVGDNGTLF